MYYNLGWYRGYQGLFKCVAKEKGYYGQERFQQLDDAYDECSRMLEGLHQALSEWRGTTRTGSMVRESGVDYGTSIAEWDWDGIRPWRSPSVSCRSSLTPITYHLPPNTSHMKRSPDRVKLEQTLRASKLVAGGFLGEDTRLLEEILAADTQTREKVKKMVGDSR